MRWSGRPDCFRPTGGTDGLGEGGEVGGRVAVPVDDQGAVWATEGALVEDSVVFTVWQREQVLEGWRSEVVREA